MGRQRTKGSIDFILENPEGYIECKRFTKSLAIGISETTRGIKWNQVEFMHTKMSKGKMAAWVIQETYDKRLIFIPHKDLMLWWLNTSSKSLNVEQALSIGREITDFEFLNVDTSKLKEVVE